MTSRANNGFMQGRGTDPDGLDDFPTPPWATRALLWRLALQYPIGSTLIREPCANRGWMVRPLAEFSPLIVASDIADYGTGFPIRDYLSGAETVVDWTITNPPYKLAVDFIERALDVSRVGVAMLLRGSFIEGERRYKRLFRERPPMILHFAERVPMFRGRIGNPHETSPAVYAWYLWTADQAGAGRYEIIPPGTRDALRRVGDW